MNRRAFLGGAAVTLALPWLESLRGGGARADDTSPVRLVYWFAPCGMHMPAFTPTTTGTHYALPPILSPLAPHRDDVTVISGLANYLGATSPAPHSFGSVGFLTGVPPLVDEVVCGVSVDQRVASRIGFQTPFASLQLGTEGPRRYATCGTDYSCAYTTHMSWSDARSPMPEITDPQVAFDRLFGGANPAATAEERARRLALRTSILDAVTQEARLLQGELGVADRRRLDAFLTNVRDLEVRIAAMDSRATCGDPDLAFDLSDDLEALIDRMSDLTALALACDLTRVVTFALANGGSLRSYDFLGVQGAHHDLSHHGGNADKQAALQIINTWELERFAYLLARLKDVSEGDGNLLDHSLVTLGNEIADGDTHTLTDLPIVLAGRGSGAVVPGRHIAYRDRPLVDLHMATAAAAGVTLAPWGNGTGAITELGQAS